MKIIKFLLFSFLFIFNISLFAQIDARMLQHPDVSSTHITFVYGGDVWLVPKEGGTAVKLSSPKGSEMFPKFSPDENQIAFNGNYDGNADIYVMPVKGGVPDRITYHGDFDRLIDWSNKGDKLLYASPMKSGRQRFNQLYLISKNGGEPEKLPMPFGEFGSLSSDDKKIAYTFRTRAFRTWKRYEGGMAADIWIFNLEDYSSEQITDHPANDEIPMWHNDKIYFLSDRDENKRNNIWVYDTNTKEKKQVTFFTDFDIHFPSIGPEEIVFEAGGDLYLLDLQTEEYRKVEVDVVTDQITIVPKVRNVSKNIQNVWLSPDGNRVLIEARGEIFSVPAKEGVIKNLTNSSGVAERYPAWSPDGKYAAYWSDQTGEYQLMLLDLTTSEKKELTSFENGYRYQLYWSPDSKKLAFINQAMEIKIYDLDKNKILNVDKGLWMFHGELENFKVDWSSDSKWMTYSRGLENRNNALFVYNTEENKTTQLTSGYYSDSSPAFDPDGKYIYFLTNRTFSPLYSDVDNSFIYPNTTNIAAVSLTDEISSLLAPKNDTVAVKIEVDEKAEKEENDDKDEKEDETKSVKIDFENFENRVVLLSPDAGNYRNLQAVSGKIIYHKMPNTGSGDKTKPVKYFDIKELEEKTIVADADGYMISADKKKMLVASNRKFAVVDIAPDQKMEKFVPSDKLETTIDPMSEWHQIFNDAWRFERDFFYDPNMHGLDWDKIGERYRKLIDDAVTRWDVNYVLGELIGELNASHTYRWGGDTEQSESNSVGYLGVDWKLENGAYRIDKIIKGALWDAEVRSPFDQPNVAVSEGDYLLAVNGVPVDASKDIYAAFQGMAGKTIELTINSSPSMNGARKVIVEALPSESRLRHLAWIEVNRKRVDEATDGEIGYIYVRSTGVDAQNELVRQFAAQFNKKGLIIDERFNSGGQIPDRFIELLNRQALAFWAVRDGKNWQWPPVANFGPKVMLINGWSGSGGDAFPDFFKKAGLGTLVGTRTWGGLIGISGSPSLVDGGSVTVPTFRMYDPDGKWFAEGHGVEPDIKVIEDPTQMAKGIDPQLEKAIDEVLRLLKENPPVSPEQPSYEIR
jgi:tricorn protease